MIHHILHAVEFCPLDEGIYVGAGGVGKLVREDLCCLLRSDLSVTDVIGQLLDGIVQPELCRNVALIVRMSRIADILTDGFILVFWLCL